MNETMAEIYDQDGSAKACYWDFGEEEREVVRPCGVSGTYRLSFS